MRVWCRFSIVVAYLIVAPPASADSELMLEWPSGIPAGSSPLAVKHYLEDRGIAVAIVAGGSTYSSKIATTKRDYLFCNDRLSNIIEGERVDGAGFNYWMSAFLAAQQKYGDPPTVKYEDLWRQSKFQWLLPSDSVLYFLIRGAPPDGIIWSRQLEHRPSSEPCK